MGRLFQLRSLSVKKLKDLTVIGIVGSYAKTSTKNILYTLLWKDFRIVKTPKSYNTELSIARSILSDLKENTEIFICEMDAYHSGEIAKLCEIAQPNLGIITAIGPQHLERFGSMEKLAGTQFELRDYLTRHPDPLRPLSEASRSGGILDKSYKSNVELKRVSNGNLLSKFEKDSSLRSTRNDSLLFLNQNDDWSIKLGNGENIVWYNDDKNKVTNLKEFSDHQTFTLHLGKENAEITLHLKGAHNAVNFLAAAVIAHRLGLKISTIRERAKLILATDHRLEVRQLGEMTILDNTYNANPKAALASLQLLSSFKGSQKIVVTPGFVELGSAHNSAHEQFAKEVAKVADEVIVVGENAKKPLIKGLEDSGFNRENIHQVETTAQALDHLSVIKKKDKVTVLLENDLPDQYF